MSTVTIYPTATDHINKQPYVVMLPPHTMTIHKEVIEQRLWAPIYEPFDNVMPQKGRITISKMVELCSIRSSFTIIDDYDILIILHQIDAYVEEVYTLRKNKEVADYLKNILHLRRMIYFHFRRVLELRPQWKIAYTQDTDIFGFLAKLYAPLGIGIDMPQTMFEELVLCPTVRAHPAEFNAIMQGKPEPETTSDTEKKRSHNRTR